MGKGILLFYYLLKDLGAYMQDYLEDLLDTVSEEFEDDSLDDYSDI